MRTIFIGLAFTPLPKSLSFRSDKFNFMTIANRESERNEFNIFIHEAFNGFKFVTSQFFTMTFI